MARFMRPIVVVGMLGMLGLACGPSQQAPQPAPRSESSTSVTEPEAREADVVNAPSEAWGPFFSRTGQEADEKAEEAARQLAVRLRQSRDHARRAMDQRAARLQASILFAQKPLAWPPQGPLFQLIPTDISVRVELIPTDAWADVVLVGGRGTPQPQGCSILGK
jgi:hypothetical protein